MLVEIPIDQPAVQLPKQAHRLLWWSIILFNRFLGAVLWLGYCTDYSLEGTIPDFIFIGLCGVYSAVVLLLSKFVPEQIRKRYKWSCLPAFIGTDLLILMLIITTPVTFLGGMFFIDELRNDKVIQRATSPNGLITAEVHFRPVGAYSGGNGRTFVAVKYRFIPFLERVVCDNNRSFATENTKNYISWRGNNQIFVSESKEIIILGIVEFRIPVIIVFPLNLIRVLMPS